MKIGETVVEKKGKKEEKKRSNILYGIVLYGSIVFLLGAGGLALKAGLSYDGILNWKKMEIAKTLQKNEEIARLLQSDLYLERLSYYWQEGKEFQNPIMQDFRNTLLISDLSGGTEIALPFLKLGGSPDILDYSLDELTKYEVIYLVKPLVNTVGRKEKLEETIRELVKLGKKILIEPAPSKDFDVFGVHVVEERKESDISLSVMPNAPKHFQVFDRTDHSYASSYVSLYGLDQEYACFLQNEEALKNCVFGMKNLEEGSVYFLGGAFQDYLTAVYMQNHDFRKIPKEILQLDARSKFFYQAVFEELGVDENGEVRFSGYREPEPFYGYYMAGVCLFSAAILLCLWILINRKAYYHLVKRLCCFLRSLLDLEF